MTTQFYALPTVASNGSGAAVDVSALGADKTIVMEGNGDALFQIYEQIEFSNDPAGLVWQPLARFLIPGTQNVQVACKWMRATTQNYKRGAAPTINVGGEVSGTSFASLVATAGNGTGASVDVSAMGGYKTVQVAGTFKGTVNIEVSNDGGTTWAQAQGFSFKNKGGAYSAILICDLMRVSRSGASTVNPGTPTIYVGAANENSLPTPDFPSSTVITTIYATATGSDTTGTGAQLNPYRTFQKAITFVPLTVPANYRYIVDVTNLGTESFPAGYAVPPIRGSGQLDQAVPSATNPWFRFRGAFSIYATPKVFTGVPLADTAIALADVASFAANAETGLYTLTITVPRASWNANACRGAIIRATGPTTTTGQGDAIVTSSTTTVLTLTVSSSPGATAIVPVGPWTLMEQSATFSGSNGAVGGSGAFNFFSNDSFAVGGIKFVNTSPANAAMAIRSAAPAFAFQYCDFGRIAIQGNAGYLPTFETCYIHGGTSIQLQGTNVLFRKCYINGITAFETIPDLGYIFAQACIWESCIPVGKVTPLGNLLPGTFTLSPQRGGGLGMWMIWNLVTGGTSHGVELSAGCTIFRTAISSNVGDGVRVDCSRGVVGLNRVTGSLNGGYGVQVMNNSVVDVTSTTTVTGTLGDMKVAANAARTWVDFRANPPLLNENDLAAGVLSQMARLFQT